jgi:ubiquinone/menaquinone biosynthesis C-methylase UbiE
MAPKTQIREVVTSHFASSDTVKMWESVYSKADDFFSYAMSARRAAVVDILRRESSAAAPTLADVGCGSGLVSQDLLALGYDVTGVDISEGMVANARKIPGLKLGIGDVENLPFADASFDNLICLGVISYVPDERKALAELRRVLKPGGRLVLAVRNKLEAAILLDPIGILVKICRKIHRRFSSAEEVGGSSYYHRNFIPWTLRHNVEQAGFSVDQCLARGYDFPGINGRRITSLPSGIRFSQAVERLSSSRGFGFLRNWGLVYILVATKRAPPP